MPRTAVRRSSCLAWPALAGIDAADSVVIDPHKWLFAPLDYAAVLYRDPDLARLTHRQSAAYLDAFGDAHVNPSDLAFHLTRAGAWPAVLVLAGGPRHRARGHDRPGRRPGRRGGGDVRDIGPPVHLVMDPQLSVVLFERDGWTAPTGTRGPPAPSPTAWRSSPRRPGTVARAAASPSSTRAPTSPPSTACSAASPEPRLCGWQHRRWCARPRSPVAAREARRRRAGRRRRPRARARTGHDRVHAARRRLPRRRRAGLGAHPPVRRRLGLRGRPADLADPRPAGREVGDDAVLLVARRGRRAARLLQRLPAPRPRAGAVRRDVRAPLDPVPVPRLALRPRRDPAVDASFTASAGFARADHGLVPVRVQEWHGWVMVNAGGDAPPVGEFLAGIEPHVADHEPERLVVGATHTYELATNWKLVVENYQESCTAPTSTPSCAGSARRRAGRTTSGTTASGSAGGRTSCRTRSRCRWTVDHRRRRCAGCTACPPTDRLHRPAAEHAREPAPRLRDDAPNGARQRHPTVVECQSLAAGDRGRAGLRPGLRRRLLGPHEPPGLGRLRVGAARALLTRQCARGRSPSTRTPWPSSSASFARAYTRRRVDAPASRHPRHRARERVGGGGGATGVMPSNRAPASAA